MVVVMVVIWYNDGCGVRICVMVVLTGVMAAVAEQYFPLWDVSLVVLVFFLFFIMVLKLLT